MKKNFDIKIVKHPHNIGYGAALKTGIKNARFDTIVISDISTQQKKYGRQQVTNALEIS